MRDVAAEQRIEDDPCVITVRCEDLVRDHLKILRRVSEFLDEAFRVYPDSSQFQESRAWFGEAREVTATSMGQWKQDGHELAVSRLYDTDGTCELIKY